MHSAASEMRMQFSIPNGCDMYYTYIHFGAVATTKQVVVQGRIVNRFSREIEDGINEEFDLFDE